MIATSQQSPRPLWSCLVALALLSAPAVMGMQQAIEKSTHDGAIASQSGDQPQPAADRQTNLGQTKKDVAASQQLVQEQITSIFVRASDSKRIMLSMLVAHQDALTSAVRQLIGEKVTPLVFSVSTLPNRSAVFEVDQLRFEQNGKSWQPQISDQHADTLPLEEDGKFGGHLSDGEIQQGIVLLPSWFSAEEPITVHYGDFNYLARFASRTSLKESPPPSIPPSSPSTIGSVVQK